MADKKEISELQSMFDIIRNEKRTHANTAERIGNAFLAILPYLGDYIRKDEPVTLQHLLTLLDGVAFGDGVSGIDADGNAELRNITNSGVITTKHLNVLGKAIFHELEIEKSKAVAGMLIVSPGAFKIDHVEEGYTDDNGVYHSYMDDNLCTGGVDAAYRCYGLAVTDGKSIDLNVVPGDQVFCQTFSYSGSSNRYYWRRVLATSNTPVIKKDQDGVDRAYHWIDISLDDYDERSEGLEGIVNDYPAPGDEVAVFGHNWGILTDSDRQSVIVISSYSSVDPDMMPPYIAQYAGLDNYDLRAHRTTFFSFGKNEITGTVRMSAESTLPDGSKVNDTIGSMQKYINDAQHQDDKQIVIWFGEEEPTAGNAPAVDWDTEEVRQAHEGDIYYNRSASAGGRAYCYKLTADGAGHEWQEITDGDVLGALEAAARAQDTADGKRTVFTARPTDAEGRYTQDIDVGDMWVDAVFPAVGDPDYTIGDVTYTADEPLYNGDILVCRIASAAGNEFSIAHWAPAQAITSRKFKSTIESLGARISLSITDLLTGLEAVGVHLVGETKKIVLNSATTEMTGDLKLKGVLQESTKCYGKGCLVLVDMETTKSITLDNISPAYPDANGWGSIVVLPQINSVVLNDRITMPRYAEAGVHLTVKVAAEKDFSAWGAVDNSSISGPYNDRNKIAALNARMVMVCADARILASSNIPGTANYIKPSGADPWRLNSYYHGMFSMHGALSRLVLMLPGQSLHLVSSIEYYETPSGLEPYLVWNVENYGDFVNISKRVVFRRDGEDIDDNRYSRIFGTHTWFDYPYPTMDPDIGYSTSLFAPEQLGDDYIHPQYTDTVPAVEVSAALGEDDPRLSIVFYE